MEKLGYIYSNQRVNNPREFIGVVNAYKDADPSKPLLIVGLDNAKKHKGFKTILDKQLGENTWWTFKKTEKRTDYERDIESFYKETLARAVASVKYYYVNIFRLGFKKIKAVYDIFFSEKKKYIYLSNDLLYILFKDNIVIGVSLNILQYCHISTKKVLHRLLANKNNVVYTDSSPFVISLRNDIKHKYTIPFLMSKEKINNDP